MAIKNTEGKPLAPGKMTQLKTGLTSLAALKDYKPQRQEYTHSKLAAVSKALDDAAKAEHHARTAYDKARDAHVAAQWDAWNFYQGAAESVIGQYGSSSDEYASLGYKKKSEYKKTIPRKKAAKKDNDAL